MSKIEIQTVELEPTLRCDLYLPDADRRNKAAIVLIFGGAWRTGEPAQQKVYALALAKAGFTCLAADYRPSTQALWPAQLEDVQAAFGWLVDHAQSLGIDPERIAVSGNSSGGHLALMMGCSTTPVKAICAFYPPTELVGLDDQGGDDSVAGLLGPAATMVALEEASPIHRANPPFPPTLFISGQSDTRVPVSHTQAMSTRLQELGSDVELHLFAGQEHAFDMERESAQLCAAILVHFFNRHT